MGGRPAIESIYGVLASVNADRGVFITTSSFSSFAEEFAENQEIVLIDGIQLNELMFEYVVYQIDHDQFKAED